jgi:hypothetical protein
MNKYYRNSTCLIRNRATTLDRLFRRSNGVGEFSTVLWTNCLSVPPGHACFRSATDYAHYTQFRELSSVLRHVLPAGLASETRASFPYSPSPGTPFLPNLRHWPYPPSETVFAALTHALTSTSHPGQGPKIRAPWPKRPDHTLHPHHSQNGTPRGCSLGGRSPFSARLLHPHKRDLRRATRSIAPRQQRWSAACDGMPG